MDSSGAARLAGSWWQAISGTSYVPASSHEARALLAGLVTDLAAALDADPFDATAGMRAGEALVRARLTNPVVVAHSIPVLCRLAEMMGRHDVAADNPRLAALVGAFAHGYAQALQKWTLAEQEAIRQAVLTARQQAEEALRASEARFRVVFNNAAVAIAVGDTQGRLVEVNPALAGMLGRDIEQLRAASVFDLFHPQDQQDIQRRVYDQLLGSGGGTVRLEERFRRADGSYGWTLLAVTLVPADGNREAYLLAVGEDVTERRQLEAELYRQARHDPLTGLANRTLLRERLEAVIANAGGEDHIGLCFLDLDGFKDINDRHGHSTGDLLLAAVAARLRAAADGNLIARIGGDEFILLVPPPVDAVRVSAAADRLLAALAEPIELNGHHLPVSASMGVVMSTLDGVKPEALLDAADTGLYRAKAEGRGQWVMHI